MVSLGFRQRHEAPPRWWPITNIISGLGVAADQGLESSVIDLRHAYGQCQTLLVVVCLFVGAGPDADRRAKLLIYKAMEGSLLDAYLPR